MSTDAGSPGEHSVSDVLWSISRHVGIAPAAADWLVTLLGLVCAVAGPLAIGSTRTWSTRRITVVVLLTASVGNLCAALASSLALLITARIITAVGVTVYVPAVSATTAFVHGGSRRARAVATVIGGSTVTLLLVLPVTIALLSRLGDYRGILLLVVAVCLLATALIVVAVPANVACRATVSDRRILRLLAASLMATIGTFSVYTYVTVIVPKSMMDSWPTIIMLAAYGLGVVVGNVVSRHSAVLLLAATVTSCLSLLVLTAAAAAPTALLGVLMAWSGACRAIHSSTTTLLSVHDKRRTPTFAIPQSTS